MHACRIPSGNIIIVGLNDMDLLQVCISMLTVHSRILYEVRVKSLIMIVLWII